MINISSIKINENNLKNINIEQGKIIGLFGKVNSGKSSILLAILGQSIKGCTFNRESDIDIKEIAYIPTNAEYLFSGIKSTLRGEMQLSAQFLNRPIPDITSIAIKFNVLQLLDRNPFSFSGGEMIRAALSICAVKNPRIWLLDQVFDFLHPDAALEIHNMLLNESQKGKTIVEVHSTYPSWAEDFNDYIFIDNIKKDKKENSYSTSQNINDKPKESHQSKKPLCILKNIEFKYKTGDFKLGPINTNFYSNDIVAIIGPNGSGKTTLLQCIANFNDNMTGDLSISGKYPTKKKWTWAKSAIYCFQNPDDQLYKSTVIDEIKTTIKSLGNTIPIDLNEQIRQFGLGSYLNAEPYQLARPLRRMVCLASTMLSGSPVILLDEPTANLDAEFKEIIFNRVCDAASKGSAIIIVSHDLPFISALANKTLKLLNGKLIN